MVVFVWTVLKGAVEFCERLEILVSLRNDRILVRPGEGDRIPANARIQIGRIDSRDLVHHDGDLTGDIKSMRQTGRNVNQVCLIGAQFKLLALAIGGRANSQIHYHIQYFTQNAVDQFGMIHWRQLEVHSPENILVGNRIVLFGKCGIQTVASKHLLMKGFNETPPIISKDLGVNFVAPWNRSLLNFHLLRRVTTEFSNHRNGVVQHFLCQAREQANPEGALHNAIGVGQFANHPIVESLIEGLAD